jgi:hypothetical protein
MSPIQFILPSQCLLLEYYNKVRTASSSPAQPTFVVGRHLHGSKGVDVFTALGKEIIPSTEDQSQ